MIIRQLDIMTLKTWLASEENLLIGYRSVEQAWFNFTGDSLPLTFDEWRDEARQYLAELVARLN